MPVVGIVLPGPMGAPAELAAPRRATTIVSSAGVTTLTVTSPEVSHTGLARSWVKIPRPGYKPFLRDGGPQLRSWRISAILYSDTGDVAAELDAMLLHAQAAQVTASYGRLEAIPAVIEELTIKTVQRRQGSNEPYWAELDVTFTEKPDDLKQVVAVAAPSAAPPAPVASPPATSGTTVTVAAGDTLWAIATAAYGDGARWSDIADANGVTDPRLLQVGQVLTIP